MQSSPRAGVDGRSADGGARGSSTLPGDDRPERSPEDDRDAPIRFFLIADIRGYTRFTQQHGDEQAGRLAARFAALTREVVAAHHGVLLELRGDEALVVFTSARRAVRAAVALQARFVAETLEDPSLPLGVGIGLDGGEAVEVEGGYRGGALNLAARLSSAAGPGEVLASQELVHMARAIEGIRYRARGPMTFKGIPDPASVVDVLGESSDNDGLRAFHAAVAEPTSDGADVGVPAGLLLGRQSELAVVDAVLARTRAGTGRLLLVEGAAGIGKTSFVEVVADRARAAGAHVVWGRCWEDGSAPSYWPWVQALRQVVAPGAATTSSLSALVPSGAGGATGDDARFVLFEAVLQVLRDAAARRPVVLLLEDLHVADVPSLLLLRYVAQQLHDLPVLLVGTLRPGEATDPVAVDALAAAARVSETIALTGLTEGELELLVGQSTGARASADLVRLLHDTTDGNPYYVKEVLRLLRTEGALKLHPARGLPLPPSVGQTVLRRLEALPPEVRPVVDVAAVLGREFSVPVLCAVMGADAESVLPALDVAGAHDLVLPVDGALGAFAFTHALTRDAVYDVVPAGRRASLHARAGEALVGLRGTPPEQLAHHFTCGAALDGGRRGIQYSVAAAEEALRRHAYERAVSLYEQALRLATAAGDMTDAGSMLIGLATARIKSGDIAGGRADQLRAVETAREQADDVLLCRAALISEAVPVEGGVVEEGMVALLEEALARAPADDVAMQARLMARLAYELMFSDQVERRSALAAQALELVQQVDDERTRFEVLRRFVGTTVGPDDIDRRLAHVDDLLALAHRHGRPELQIEAHVHRTAYLLQVNRIDGFHIAAEHVVRLAGELTQPQARWYGAVLDLLRRRLRGEVDEFATAADRVWQEHVTVRNAAGAWAVAVVHDAVDRGRGVEFEDLIRSILQTRPGISAPWTAALIRVLANAGREGEARELLHELVDRLPRLPRDGQYLVALTWAAGAVYVLDAREAARPVRDALLPYTGQHAFAAMPVPVDYSGPVDLALGEVSAVLGDHEAVDRHLTAAAQASARLGARPYLVRTWAVHGRSLLMRGGAQDSARGMQLLSEAEASAEQLGLPGLLQGPSGAPIPSPVHSDRPALVEEPDHWVVTFDGRTTRHRGGKGFRYLALLLETPGREVHVLDLVAAVEGTDRTAVASDGDLGPALDPQARASYRRRLEELQDDLTEADGSGDVGRAAAARAEFDFLTDELSRSLGIGGRDRRSGGQAEQARSSVSKVLHRLLGRLGESDAELARHLRATLRTGVFCGYLPDIEPVRDWDIRRRT